MLPFIIVFNPASTTLTSLLSYTHWFYMHRVAASHQQSYSVSRVWPAASRRTVRRPMPTNRAAPQSRRPRRAAVLRMHARDGILNANTNASVSPKWPQLSAYGTYGTYGTYATRGTRQLPTNRRAASTLSLSQVNTLVPVTLDRRWRSNQLVCMLVNQHNKVFISFVFYSDNRNALTPCKNVLNRYDNAFWQQVQMCCVCFCAVS